MGWDPRGLEGTDGGVCVSAPCCVCAHLHAHFPRRGSHRLRQTLKWICDPTRFITTNQVPLSALGGLGLYITGEGERGSNSTITESVSLDPRASIRRVGLTHDKHANEAAEPGISSTQQVSLRATGQRPGRLTPGTGFRREEAEQPGASSLCSRHHPTSTHLYLDTAESEEARLAPGDALQAPWRPGQRRFGGKAQAECQAPPPLLPRLAGWPVLPEEGSVHTAVMGPWGLQGYTSRLR